YIEELVEPVFVRNQPVIVRHFFDHSAERLLALPCAELRVQKKGFRLAESVGSLGRFFADKTLRHILLYFEQSPLISLAIFHLQNTPPRVLHRLISVCLTLSRRLDRLFRLAVICRRLADV